MNGYGTATRAGAGVIMNPAVPFALRPHPDALDFVEVVPETTWVDHGVGRSDRFAEIAGASASLQAVAAGKPIRAHGLGISIGSALPLDRDHLDQVARWLDRHAVAAYSEHLSYFTLAAAPGSAVGRRHAGVALPLVHDDEMLELIAAKVDVVHRATSRRLLLENGVVHTPIPGQPRTEAQFLTDLVAASGCGILLDLHNLYTDCVNHDLDPDEYMDQLDCDAVIEMHVAGGVELLGMHTDSHTGAVLPSVWGLLVAALRRCPNVEAVTFEFHESSYAQLTGPGVVEQLDVIRSIVAAIAPSEEVVGHGAR